MYKFVVLPFLLIALSACISVEAKDRGNALAHAQLTARTAEPLQFTSPAFADGEPIPLRYSAYDRGISPSFHWDAVPAGTRSLALIMQDPDAATALPFVHWLAWNIDPELMALPEEIPQRKSAVNGMRQGSDSKGRFGYFGPRPRDEKPHHYHFQLFALDLPLTLMPGATRDELLAALDGHVIASSALLAQYTKSAEDEVDWDDDEID